MNYYEDENLYLSLNNPRMNPHDSQWDTRQSVIYFSQRSCNIQTNCQLTYNVAATLREYLSQKSQEIAMKAEAESRVRFNQEFSSVLFSAFIIFFQCF